MVGELEFEPEVTSPKEHVPHLSTSLTATVRRLSEGNDTGRVPGGPGISGLHVDLQQLWPTWADWTGQSCQVGQ